MEVNIRQEVANDQKAVYEVNRLAFEREAEAQLVDLLRQSDAFIPELSLAATVHEQTVGYVLFSKIVIVGENQTEFESLALAPVAVHPEFQRKGIGGLLIQTGLKKARALNHSSVIVLGHADYYPKFGFVPASRWNIKAPFEVRDEVFMGLELLPEGLKGVSGTVRYPEAFGMV